MTYDATVIAYTNHLFRPSDDTALDAVVIHAEEATRHNHANALYVVGLVVVFMPHQNGINRFADHSLQGLDAAVRRLVIAVDADVDFVSYSDGVHGRVDLVAIADADIVAVCHAGRKVPLDQIIKPLVFQGAIFGVDSGVIASDADEIDIVEMRTQTRQKLCNQFADAHDLFDDIFLICDLNGMMDRARDEIAVRPNDAVAAFVRPRYLDDALKVAFQHPGALICVVVAPVVVYLCAVMDVVQADQKVSLVCGILMASIRRIIATGRATLQCGQLAAGDRMRDNIIEFFLTCAIPQGLGPCGALVIKLLPLDTQLGDLLVNVASTAAGAHLLLICFLQQVERMLRAVETLSRVLRAVRPPVSILG